MKKRFRLTALLATLMILSVSVFTACGGSSKGDGGQKEAVESKKQDAETPSETEPAEAAGETQAQAESAAVPTAEDARAYVKAVLDLMCTGEYDHSVNMADITAGEESTLRDDTIAATVSSIGGSAGLSEDNQSGFTEVLKEAYSKCRYTVGDAVPTEDGGFDVTVSIEPLAIYSGAQEKMREKLSSQDVSGLSEEKQNNLIYSAIIEIIRENLDEPVYGEPGEVVVHYGLIDEANNLYGVTEEEGEKLGKALFYADTE